MGKARVKDIKEYIKALEVIGAENVVLEADDLLGMLDRMLVLEKREAKRKAKKKKALSEPIVVGDRVELVDTFETHLWPYVVKGAQGTVALVRDEGTHRFRVNLDNSNDHSLTFAESEIRKIA